MPSYHKPTHSKYFHGPLYQQMHDDLQLTGKAERTVHGYLRGPPACRSLPQGTR